MKQSKGFNKPKTASGNVQHANRRLSPSQTFKLRKKRKAFKTRALPRKSNIKLVCTQHSTPPVEENCIQIDTSWSIETYRNPRETDAFWNLKKWFMELHKHSIPEDELVPLAQAFANVEVMGCCYDQELMDRLKQLGEPIAGVYRNLKHNKCTPTLMLASEAARLHRIGITYAQEMDNTTRWQIENLRSIIPTYTLGDIFQNIVVVNNSLQETNEFLERIGGGTISLVMRQRQHGLYEVKAYVCHFFITKSAGPYEQAHSQCMADLMEILKNYCYQVNYIRRFPVLHFNVEKLTGVAGTNGSKSIRKDNVGYRLLQRLGWTGGPLGYKQTGIVDPINVPAKHDRRGLGCTKQTKKKRSYQVCQSECTMDTAFYCDLMESALVRKPYYDLIFSPEFTESERIILTRHAVQRRIRCETRDSGNGQMQFVLKRFPLLPHEVLINVLVKKDPLVQKYYEVVPPKVGRIARWNIGETICYC